MTSYFTYPSTFEDIFAINSTLPVGQELLKLMVTGTGLSPASPEAIFPRETLLFENVTPGTEVDRVSCAFVAIPHSGSLKTTMLYSTLSPIFIDPSLSFTIVISSPAISSLGNSGVDMAFSISTLPLPSLPV